VNKRLKTAAKSFLLSWVTLAASLIVLLLSPGLKAQKSEGYDPMDLHSDKSRTLIQDVNAQILGEEIEGGSLKSNFWLQGAQHDQALFLTKHIKLGLFIQDDSLQAFVDHAMGRIVSTNRLPERRRIVLIMNTPEANAVCFGQGLFIVTVGLLGKVHNEAELTFILSHEVAHDELQHVQEKLRREADTRTTKRTRYAFYNLLTNDVRQEDIDSFRALMYTSSSFNRSKETEADSLGFVYYKSTSFPAYGARDGCPRKVERTKT
jgi:Peptidase family M48